MREILVMIRMSGMLWMMWIDGEKVMSKMREIKVMIDSRIFSPFPKLA